MNSIKKKFMIRLIALQFVFALLIIIACPSLISLVGAQAPTTAQDPAYSSMLVLGVTLSVSVPALAAGYVLKTTGTAAVSALTERESTFGKALVLVALGEALAIYGLIIAIMLMQKLPV
jgi:V/A-type H+-transporting ATPase subunit K